MGLAVVEEVVAQSGMLVVPSASVRQHKKNSTSGNWYVSVFCLIFNILHCFSIAYKLYLYDTWLKDLKVWMLDKFSESTVDCPKAFYKFPNLIILELLLFYCKMKNLKRKVKMF